MDGEQPSDETSKIQVLAERLAPLADAAGVPRPDLTAFQGPEIRTELPIRSIVLQVAEVLRGRNLLFTRNSVEPGTINLETGAWLPMTPARFVSWLPRQGITTTEPNPEARKNEAAPTRRAVDLSEHKARQILAADDLLQDLPQLRAVNRTRLPVLRSELDEMDDPRRKGFRRIELLPVGYDEPSGIYTIPGPRSQLDDQMAPEEAADLLQGLLRHFPWADEHRKAVHLAATLTAFCDGLFSGRSPLFLYCSNLAGSGKSALARLALEPVLGPVGATELDPRDTAELRKVLDTAAQEGSAAIWFDDLPTGTKLFHSPLLGWLTSEVRSGRIMGRGAAFTALVRAVTVATGAQIELGEHLGRRTLLVDLFPTMAAADRELPGEAIAITSEFFQDEARMRQIRGALWALVKNWDGVHRPHPTKLLASFENWSRVVPGIVEAAGFGEPLREYAAANTGNTERGELKTLAHLAIRRFALADEAAGLVTLADLAAISRERELFVDILGHLDVLVLELDRQRGFAWDLANDGSAPTPGEKRRQAARYLDKSTATKFAGRIRKAGLIGMHFKVDGRTWQFGSRREAKGIRWLITEVKQVPPDQAA